MSDETRECLPDERIAITHEFQIVDQVGHVTVGLYTDGRPGEVFIRIAKEGDLLKGSIDAWATAISIGLQYGVPLSAYTTKFTSWAFEPSGVTSNPDIPLAQSVIDYVARWLQDKFPS